MNNELITIANKFLGEWAIIASDIPSVVKSFRRYLNLETDYSEALDSAAVHEWFAHRLSPQWAGNH